MTLWGALFAALALAASQACLAQQGPRHAGGCPNSGLAGWQNWTLPADAPAQRTIMWNSAWDIPLAVPVLWSNHTVVLAFARQNASAPKRGSVVLAAVNQANAVAWTVDTQLFVPTDATSLQVSDIQVRLAVLPLGGAPPILLLLVKECGSPALNVRMLEWDADAQTLRTLLATSFFSVRRLLDTAVASGRTGAAYFATEPGDGRVGLHRLQLDSGGNVSVDSRIAASSGSVAHYNAVWSLSTRAADALYLVISGAVRFVDFDRLALFQGKGSAGESTVNGSVSSGDNVTAVSEPTTVFLDDPLAGAVYSLDANGTVALRPLVLNAAPCNGTSCAPRWQTTIARNATLPAAIIGVMPLCDEDYAQNLRNRCRGLVLVCLNMSHSPAAPAASGLGVVRGLDATTGALIWDGSFQTPDGVSSLGCRANSLALSTRNVAVSAISGRRVRGLRFSTSPSSPQKQRRVDASQMWIADAPPPKSPIPATIIAPVVTSGMIVVGSAFFSLLATGASSSVPLAPQQVALIVVFALLMVAAVAGSLWVAHARHNRVTVAARAPEKPPPAVPGDTIEPPARAWTRLPARASLWRAWAVVRGAAAPERPAAAAAVVGPDVTAERLLTTYGSPVGRDSALLQSDPRPASTRPLTVESPALSATTLLGALLPALPGQLHPTLPSPELLPVAPVAATGDLLSIHVQPDDGPESPALLAGTSAAAEPAAAHSRLRTPSIQSCLDPAAVGVCLLEKPCADLDELWERYYRGHSLL